MEIKIQPRYSGKTTSLIQQAAKDFSYIVCINQEECSRVFHYAISLGLGIPMPITATEFFNGHFHSKGIKSFCFDNLDLMLKRYARGVPITQITMSSEEVDDGE